MGMALAAGSRADPVTFTETFDSSAEGWRQVDGSSAMTHHADGGPGGAGDGYVSATLSFEFSNDGDGLVFARGHGSYLPQPSGGAFVGNWVGSGVTEFSMWVWHDVPAAVEFGARFASPVNFPGAAVVEPTLVAPNTWTELNLAIDPSNPNLTVEFGSFASVFGNIGNVQLFMSVPGGFGGEAGSFSFGVDNLGVAVIPEPAAAALVLVAGLALMRRRR